jgi:HEPN domain-containing protein/predicted nucleotidyltransferase
MAVVHEPLPQQNKLTGILERACALILQSLQPERIMLFGSQARGDAHESSDIDLLVVLRESLSREGGWEYARQLTGLGKSIDLKFVEYEKFVHEAAIIGTLYNAALTEGRVLFIDSDEVRMTAEDWIERAEQDIRSAKTLAAARTDDVNIPWLAHQAAEKAIKGLLISKAIRHERSHGLVELCAGLGPGHALLALREELELPTSVALGSRYPNQLDVTARDVSNCLEAADRVIAIVRAELGS